MAFSKKTWLDRIAEYPTRRRLRKSDGSEELVTVAREEGTISQEGDAFSAANMNDLEERVSNEFDALNKKMELVRSHVGMIVQSTTLDTEAKVIAIYGGTSWSKIEGRFLIGASSSYVINSTGGEATHTLTISEMPSHNHASSTKKGAIPCWDNKASSTGKYYGLYDGSLAYQSSYAYDINTTSTSYAGGNQKHNNMPPYKAVYIWERTK